MKMSFKRKSKGEKKETSQNQVDGPKKSPSATVFNGAPTASSVFIHTTFPHQFKSVPPFGNCNPKKITIKLIATPASNAALKI